MFFNLFQEFNNYFTLNVSLLLKNFFSQLFFFVLLKKTND